MLSLTIKSVAEEIRGKAGVLVDSWAPDYFARSLNIHI